MAYRFKQDDGSVERGVRRIALRELEKTVADIDDRRLTDAETVHRIRKRCKKLRGLIRLVRPAFPGYAEENAAFREAARMLSGIRDADVMVKTYDAMMEACGGEVDRRTMVPVRRALTARLDDAQDAGTVGERLDLFRQNMIAAGQRVPDWTIRKDRFAALGPGLAKTFGRARKAMAEAQAEPTPEHMHAWRKRVKYHWCHARLLEPCFPGVLTAHKKTAKRLGSLLGDHHDLAVFINTLETEEVADADRRKTAVELARRRLADVEAEAFPLGARLFAEEAGDISKRWERWWTIWREEVERQAAAA